MTLAVSNIAWPADEEAEVARTLADLGVNAVELAPTKVFDDPLAVSDGELDAYRAFWADHGIRVVAFQSLLFGRNDLVLFGDAATRRAALDRLTGFVELAGRMGAGVLVFGSPKNRQVPDGMGEAEALDIATDVFRALGAEAVTAGTRFCIEPNPPQYDCNFVFTARQGAELVDRVDSPGFGLHLDAAGMTLAGDDVFSSIVENPGLAHFHASAPQLGELEETVVDHSRAARALHAIDYPGTVSIEMRPGNAGDAPARVRRAVELARRHYSAVL